MTFPQDYYVDRIFLPTPISKACCLSIKKSINSVKLEQNMEFEETGFPDRPLIRKAFELLRGHEREPHLVSPAQTLCSRFKDASEEGIVAAILASSPTTHIYEKDLEKFDVG